MAETEGASLAASHGIGFCEVSVAENTPSLYKAFERLLTDSKGRPVKQRKFSVCKMIGESYALNEFYEFQLNAHIFPSNSSNHNKQMLTCANGIIIRFSRAENQRAHRNKTHKTNDSLWFFVCFSFSSHRSFACVFNSASCQSTVSCFCGCQKIELLLSSRIWMFSFSSHKFTRFARARART